MALAVPMPDLCDTDEAAASIGVPGTTLVYWRAHKTGPRWYKIGRRVMYDRGDLAAFVAAGASQ